MIKRKLRLFSAFLIKFTQDDRGTIEPALVLIPLVILVLSTLQIAGGVYARVSTSNLSQAALYEQALFDSGGSANLDNGASANLDNGGGATSSSSSAVAPDGELGVNRIPLPGGGLMLLGTENKSLPSISPLLPGGDAFTTHSLVISEEPQ